MHMTGTSQGVCCFGGARELQCKLGMLRQGCLALRVTVVHISVGIFDGLESVFRIYLIFNDRCKVDASDFKVSDCHCNGGYGENMFNRASMIFVVKSRSP